uniref:Protein kinase domain-containing protein n=1 Tax=viral metagenome TaxID=1070528 RepID=A0A6C0CT04_9ZZZZ
MKCSTTCNLKDSLKVYVKPLEFGVKLGYRLSTKPRNKETGKWIRDSLISLGPTYIKIGQVISSRPDLFPTYVTDELISLQTNVPCVAFQDVKSIIENEYGKNIEEIFSEIKPKPIASASIGQVHLAKLKHNNKVVVVKVQKPKIEDTILNELDVINTLLKLFEMFQIKKVNDLLLVLNDSCKNIKIELDFINEKKNILLFQSIFKNSELVQIPKVYSKLTTKKVIVMEYVPGIKIDELKHKSLNFNGEMMSKKLMTTFILCLLQSGYLHADPHAGNISIINDKIILYDFGIVAKYNINIKDALKDIFIAFLSKNTDVVINRVLENDIIFMKNSSATSVSELSSIEYVTLYRLVNYLFEYSETLDINKFQSNLLSDNFLDVDNLPFDINPEMLLLFKTFATLEGVCKNIYPEFNYFILIDELFNELLDVDVLSQKISTDIKFLLDQFRFQPKQDTSNDLKTKLQSARMDQMNDDSNNRYRLLMIATFLSTLMNVISSL